MILFPVSWSFLNNVNMYINKSNLRLKALFSLWKCFNGSICTARDVKARRRASTHTVRHGHQRRCERIELTWLPYFLRYQGGLGYLLLRLLLKLTLLLGYCWYSDNRWCMLLLASMNFVWSMTSSVYSVGRRPCLGAWRWIALRCAWTAPGWLWCCCLLRRRTFLVPETGCPRQLFSHCWSSIWRNRCSSCFGG